MKAYRLDQIGSLDGLVLAEERRPEPGPTEILVRLAAMSLNRRDLMILNGTYPLPPRGGIVPLSDGAGEVVAVGSAVTRFRPGERVTGSYFPRWRAGRFARDLVDQLGCTLDGMLADYALLDEQWAVALPEHLSFEEGATLTCAGVTAWNATVGQGVLAPGDTVLTLGTGGVSLFAIQFAKMIGCTVIATTSRRGKAERLAALGADHVIDHAATPAWAERVREVTGGRGADLVVETIGPDTIAQSLAASALHGHIVVVSVRSATKNGLELPGDVYARSLVSTSRLFVGSRNDLEAMTRAVAAAKLRPVIDRVFPFAAAKEAYRYLQAGNVFGKVVIAAG